MNDLCYEYSQDGVCLNSFDYVFVQKEVRCTSKTEKTITIRRYKYIIELHDYIYA